MLPDEEPEDMADGRFISKSLSVSTQFADLVNNDHRLMFLMVIPHLDRDGRVGAEPRQLRALVCPLLDYTASQLGAAVADFIRQGMVIEYIDGSGTRVLEFTGFRRQQKGLRHDRETPSRFGPPVRSSGIAPEESGIAPEESGRSRREVEDKTREAEVEATRAPARNAAPAPAAHTPDYGIDPRQLAIEQELLRHRSIVACLGSETRVEKFAADVMGVVQIHQQPAWFVQAIKEASCEVEEGNTADATRRLLRKYIQNARAPKANEQPSGGAPYHAEFSAEREAEEERIRLESRARGAAIRVKVATLPLEAEPLPAVESMTLAGGAVAAVLKAAKDRKRA